MTTENVMKLGKIERLSFSFVLLSFLQIYQPWPFECKQTILPMYRIIKNQFELNSEKCIKMRMSGPKFHIELAVISR